MSRMNPRRFVIILAAITLVAASASAAAAKPHLLVVNDDGIDAPGLAALVAAFEDGYRITVAAPAFEQSGVSQAITYRDPVVVEERPGRDGVRRFAVDSQPATCARLALTGLIANDPPVAVLSGINKGENTGDSVWISGTLGGAREAALVGFPAIAFSAAYVSGDPIDFATAGRWARAIVDQLLAAQLLRRGELLKVEFPHPVATAKGVRIARVGSEPPARHVYVEQPAAGATRTFKAQWAPPKSDRPGTDTREMYDAWIVVTPMSLDQTDYRRIPELITVPWTAPALPGATR